MPKYAKYCLLLLCLGCISCDPYTGLHQLEDDILRQFPHHAYARIWETSDTLIFYPPQKLKKHLHQIKGFQSRITLLKPTPKWAPDKQIVQQELKSYLLALDEHFSSFQSDPSIYNIGGRLVRNLSDPRLSSEAKSRLCLQHLEKASLYYRTAQLCIDQPAPERLQLAIEKQLAGLQLMEGPLADSLQQWALPAERQNRLQKALYIAQLACKDYIAFCNSLLFEKREATLFSKE